MSKELMKIKEETVDAIALKVQKLQQCGELDLPANYSAANALKSAWLILQATEDKDHRPVLEVCTRESITNSLLDMVVQGLNAQKKQGYFIAYGKALVFQRSYFGSMAVAKMVDESIDDDGIVAEVVYEGDVFKYKLERGKKIITHHEQDFANVDKKKIIGAYCVVYNREGDAKSTVIMTIEELKQAWKQSKMSPVNEKGEIRLGSVHDKFTAEQCKKTVINRACKPIINSSNDRGLLRQATYRSDEVRAETEAQEVVEREANKGPVVDTENVVDCEYKEEPAEKEVPEKEEQPEPTKEMGDQGPDY